MKDEDMDENALEESMVEQLRADAEQLDPDATDVDALVLGALRQGRRRRTRRRVLGASAGLVAAGLVAIAVAVVAPDVLQRQTTGIPIAASPSATGGPSSTGSPSPASPSASTSPSVASVASVRAGTTPTDVQDALTALLPGSLTVVHGSAARDEGSDGFPWELNAALTVQDSAGTSYVLGGVGDGSYDDGCFNLADCEVLDVAGGGTLWITSGPPGDKSGQDRSFRYNRPDGGHIWLMQRNYPSGSAPVTRDGLPLSDAAARRLVTSSGWDALFTS